MGALVSECGIANKAAFPPHVVFASREHAYCAVLAAGLAQNSWRIEDDPEHTGRCVLSILDDGADWKGLFCWDGLKTVLTWQSHVKAREKGETEGWRKAYFKLCEACITHLTAARLICELSSLSYSEDVLESL